MAEQIANYYATSLNAAIDADDTSVSVTDGSGFPSVGTFRCVIQDSEDNPTSREIVLVTARSSNTLTVTRGQESTSGVNHADGSYIAIVLTAGAITSSSGYLLAFKSHTAGDETTTSTTLVDLDATNAVVTFTAPASGSVLIRLTAVVGPQATASSYVSWGIRESTSIIEGAVGESIANRNAAATVNEYRSCSMVFVRTGLTAGTSYTYKWAWATSTGTGNQKANASAPSVMEVWAL